MKEQELRKKLVGKPKKINERTGEHEYKTVISKSELRAIIKEELLKEKSIKQTGIDAEREGEQLKGDAWKIFATNAKKISNQMKKEGSGLQKKYKHMEKEEIADGVTDMLSNSDVDDTGLGKIMLSGL